MKDIESLLNAAKEATGAANDSELARKVGVKPSAINNYRRGVSLPNPVVCATLAGLTGEPLHRVLGVVGEARAISPEEKKVWRRLAATALGLVLLAGSALPFTTSANASETGALYALCEIKDGSEGRLETSPFATPALVERGNFWPAAAPTFPNCRTLRSRISKPAL